MSDADPLAGYAPDWKNRETPPQDDPLAGYSRAWRRRPRATRATEAAGGGIGGLATGALADMETRADPRSRRAGLQGATTAGDVERERAEQEAFEALTGGRAANGLLTRTAAPAQKVAPAAGAARADAAAYGREAAAARGVEADEFAANQARERADRASRPRRRPRRTGLEPGPLPRDATAEPEQAVRRRAPWLFAEKPTIGADDASPAEREAAGERFDAALEERSATLALSPQLRAVRAGIGGALEGLTAGYRDEVIGALPGGPNAEALKMAEGITPRSTGESVANVLGFLAGAGTTIGTQNVLAQRLAARVGREGRAGRVLDTLGRPGAAGGALEGLGYDAVFDMPEGSAPGDRVLNALAGLALGGGIGGAMGLRSRRAARAGETPERPPETPAPGGVLRADRDLDRLANEAERGLFAAESRGLGLIRGDRSGSVVGAESDFDRLVRKAAEGDAEAVPALRQVYEAGEPVRALLRERHGPTVTLWRSEFRDPSGRVEGKPTTYYADRRFAERFGDPDERALVSREVPVEDIIHAGPASVSGGVEFLVANDPRSLRQALSAPALPRQAPGSPETPADGFRRANPARPLSEYPTRDLEGFRARMEEMRATAPGDDLEHDIALLSREIEARSDRMVGESDQQPERVRAALPANAQASTGLAPAAEPVFGATRDYSDAERSLEQPGWLPAGHRLIQERLFDVRGPNGEVVAAGAADPGQAVLDARRVLGISAVGPSALPDGYEVVPVVTYGARSPAGDLLSSGAESVERVRADLEALEVANPVSPARHEPPRLPWSEDEQIWFYAGELRAAGDMDYSRAEEVARRIVALPENSPERAALFRQEKEAATVERLRRRVVTPARQVGAETPVSFADGGQARARYRLMEADELRPSHDPVTFAPRQDYPAGVQGRDYHRDRAAQEQVAARTLAFDPERLLDRTALAASGPPLVTPDGIVAAGNERAMLRLRVAQQNPQAREAYVRALEERAGDFGLSPEQVRGMREPVLVRELADVDASDPEVLRALNTRSDESVGKAKDALSDAATRARSLRGGAALRHFADTFGADDTLSDYLAGPQGRAFVDELVRDGAIPRAEQARFRDVRTGALNEDGRALVRRMVLLSAIPDTAIVEAAPAAVLAKLEGGLPAVLRASATDGWDLGPALRDALSVHVEAKSRGVKVRDLLDTEEMFPVERHPAAAGLALLLDGAKKADVTDALRRYAEAARGAGETAGMGSLFGDAPATPGAALAGVLERMLAPVRNEIGAVGDIGERIVAAAYRHPDGRVFTGAIHADAEWNAMQEGWRGDEEMEPGFVTSRGRYVGRAEARQIADNAQQVRSDAELGYVPEDRSTLGTEELRKGLEGWSSRVLRPPRDRVGGIPGDIAPTILRTLAASGLGAAIGGATEDDPVGGALAAAAIAGVAPAALRRRGARGLAERGAVGDLDLFTGPERVVAATVRDPRTGKVYRGANHGLAIEKAADDGASWAELTTAWDEGNPEVVGFATNRREFVSREEAQRAVGLDPADPKAPVVAEELVGRSGHPIPGRMTPEEVVRATRESGRTEFRDPRTIDLFGEDPPPVPPPTPARPRLPGAQGDLFRPVDNEIGAVGDLSRLPGGASPLAGTRVADEAGEPRVVYHGTSAAFQNFDPQQVNEHALYGPGYYFTDDPEVAGGTGGKDELDDIAAYAAINRAGYSFARMRYGPDRPFGAKEVSRVRRLLNSKEYLRDAYEDIGTRENWRRGMVAVEAGPERVAEWVMNDAPAWIRNRMGLQREAVTYPNVRPARLAVRDPFDIDAPVDTDTAGRVLAVLEAMRDEMPDPALLDNLRVTRPLRAALAGETLDDWVHRPEDAPTGENVYQVISTLFESKKTANEALRRAGFDGISYEGGKIMGGRPHRVWVAFDPEQIRSAFGPAESAARAGFATAPVLAGVAGAGTGALLDPEHPLRGMLEGLAVTAGAMGGARWAVRRGSLLSFARKVRTAEERGTLATLLRDFGDEDLAAWASRLESARRPEAAVLARELEERAVRAGLPPLEAAEREVAALERGPLRTGNPDAPRINPERVRDELAREWDAGSPEKRVLIAERLERNMEAAQERGDRVQARNFRSLLFSLEGRGYQPSPRADVAQYVNLRSFNLDPGGEARLSEQVRRMVEEEGLDPKERVTWAETAREARELGLGVLDVAQEGRTLTRVELLALRDVVRENVEGIRALTDDLARATSDTQRASIVAEIEAAERQNMALLSRFTRDRSEAGRTLNSFKILANSSMDYAAWYARVERIRAARGLTMTPEVAAELRRIIDSCG